MTPAYLELGLDALRGRARRALRELADCRLCPRDCGVDRRSGKWSACKTGRWAVVSSAFPHFGEEDCLRGRYGSGTIFFAHCNLRCVFCQNFEISQGVRPGPPRAGGARPSSSEALARTMLRLQALGCHNLNFVTPEHVVPQMLEALVLAVEGGLALPVVYNTSAYDSLESLRLLDGVVDIYMPDFKLWSPEASERYLKARDYPEAARAAIAEMHRQVGDLVVGADGLARRGVLVRHLVMPGMPGETEAILDWLAAELGPGTYVNVMGQYGPAGRVRGSAYAEIGRPLRGDELAAAVGYARDLGLRLDERRSRRPAL
ncbi:MAG: radical SAM protein [Gemmatimonadota bacterium]